MGKLLEAALFYHSLGWSIIPICKNDKRPFIKSWQEYQNRQATIEELEKWFKEDYLNLALVCGGFSGIAVIDDDSYKLQGGQIKIASSQSVKTPRGGTHYYFKCPKNLRPSVNEEIAIDVRANGSYVLLPPSKLNDVPYTWTANKRSSFQNLAELPLEYLDKIKPRDSKENVDFSKFLNVSEGGRDDSLYRALCSALNRIPDDKREVVGWDLALGINNSYKPPLPEKQVSEKLEQALKFVRSNPFIKSTISTELSSNIAVNREDRLIKVKEIFKEGHKQGLSTGFPSLDNIIHGLQYGQTYLIFADTNVGKSVFALNILISVAKKGVASAYFDLENSADLTHERMILINDPILTKSEFDVLLKNKELDPYLDSIYQLGIDSWSLDEINDRFGSITFEAILSIIKEDLKKGTKVFCIDHLHYFEPSQTDYAKLGDIARQLNTIAAKEHIVILFVAHTKKGLSFENQGKIEVKRPTLEDVSGSKLIVAHTKNVISLKRNEQSDESEVRSQTTVYVNKQKTGSTGKFDLAFDPQKLTFKDIFSYSQVTHSKAKNEELRFGDDWMDHVKPKLTPFNPKI